MSPRSHVHIAARLLVYGLPLLITQVNIENAVRVLLHPKASLKLLSSLRRAGGKPVCCLTISRFQKGAHIDTRSKIVSPTLQTLTKSFQRILPHMKQAMTQVVISAAHSPNPIVSHNPASPAHSQLNILMPLSKNLSP